MFDLRQLVENHFSLLRQSPPDNLVIEQLRLATAYTHFATRLGDEPTLSYLADLSWMHPTPPTDPVESAPTRSEARGATSTADTPHPDKQPLAHGTLYALINDTMYPREQKFSPSSIRQELKRAEQQGIAFKLGNNYLVPAHDPWKYFSDHQFERDTESDYVLINPRDAGLERSSTVRLGHAAKRGELLRILDGAKRLYILPVNKLDAYGISSPKKKVKHSSTNRR